MLASDAAKDYTGFSGAVPSENVVLRGLNEPSLAENPTDLQVRRLTRRYALSLPLALVVAGLAYGGRS